MIIELQQALSPELAEADCGLCGVRSQVESVAAWCNHAEPVCPECVRYLGERNPECFPSFEEYRTAVERYPQPMYPSVEALLELEAEEPEAIGRVLAASAVEQ